MSFSDDDEIVLKLVGGIILIVLCLLVGWWASAECERSLCPPGMTPDMDSDFNCNCVVKPVPRY